MLNSKCFRIAIGVPLYVFNRQVHEDEGVPLFADHIRTLTVNFESNLAVVGNNLVRELGRSLR